MNVLSISNWSATLLNKGKELPTDALWAKEDRFREASSIH